MNDQPTPDQAPQQDQSIRYATPEQKRHALAQAVAFNVASGMRVESQTEEQAILVKGKGTNHTLHLIITVITCGLWGFVWPVVWAINREKRFILTVDPYGNVLKQQAG